MDLDVFERIIIRMAMNMPEGYPVKDYYSDMPFVASLINRGYMEKAGFVEPDMTLVKATKKGIDAISIETEEAIS